MLFALIFLTCPALSLGADKVPVYFTYHGGAKGKSSSISNNDHPLLDGALIVIGWSQAEPRRGKFDWSLVERHVSEWNAGGKPVLFKVLPYNQDPIPGDRNGDNSQTPQWIYDAGVRRISFPGGGVAGRKTVSVPRVWDSAFYAIYEEYIEALAAKYDSDPRVTGVKIGIGHLGNLVAQPSKGGNTAFQQAGWTLPIWEEHTKRVIDIYVKHFKKKQLLIRVAGGFLKDFRVSNNLEVMHRILQYAAQRKVSILFGGLDANVDRFNRTGVRELVSYLGTLNPPSGFSIGFTDDWPLWVPPHRSSKCPGPTCGRDVRGFRNELQTAFDLWSSVNRKFPMFLVFHGPETSATNEKNPAFNKAVYDVAAAFLFSLPEDKRQTESEQKPESGSQPSKKKKRPR